MFKFIRVVILIALVLALVVYFGVPLLLKTGWARDKVQKALAENTGRDVEVGSISFNWFSGLKVGDVVVNQKPGQLASEGPLFKLGELSFAIGIKDVLDQKINIENLSVDEPEFVIVRDAAGNMNFADLVDRPATEKTESGQTPEASVNLEIDGGRVVFLDQKLDTRVEAKEIEADARWRNGELTLDLGLELNGGATKLAAWFDLSKENAPFRIDRFSIEGAELSANLAQLGLVIPLMGEDLEKATGTLQFSLVDLNAAAMSGPLFSQTLTGKGEVTLDAGTLVSRPASQLVEAVRTARLAIQVIRDKDYTKLLKMKLPGMGGAPAATGTLDVDRLHGTFTIRNGRVETNDMSLKASDFEVTAAGWAGLDGSVQYVFEEAALTERFLKLVRERPELRQLIGDKPQIHYRKSAAGAGGFEIPWLKPENLARTLMASGLLEKTGILDKAGGILEKGGLGEKLKDLLPGGK